MFPQFEIKKDAREPNEDGRVLIEFLGEEERNREAKKGASR